MIHRSYTVRGRPPSESWESREEKVLKLLSVPRPHGWLAAVLGWERPILRPTLERLRQKGLVEATGHARAARWALKPTLTPPEPENRA